MYKMIDSRHVTSPRSLAKSLSKSEYSTATFNCAPNNFVRKEISPLKKIRGSTMVENSVESFFASTCGCASAPKRPQIEHNFATTPRRVTWRQRDHRILAATNRN